MARPEVAIRFRPEVAAALAKRSVRLKLEPHAFERFFATAIARLSGEAREVARFGIGANTWALAAGNYFFAYANNGGFGIAGFDTAVVPSSQRAFTFASAVLPVVLASYPLSDAGRVTGPAYWSSYTAACDALLASRQGQSSAYLTSRVRSPLGAVLEAERPARTGSAQ